jgi:hypothetical protein
MNGRRGGESTTVYANLKRHSNKTDTHLLSWSHEDYAFTLASSSLAFLLLEIVSPKEMEKGETRIQTDFWEYILCMKMTKIERGWWYDDLSSEMETECEETMKEKVGWRSCKERRKYVTKNILSLLVRWWRCSFTFNVFLILTNVFSSYPSSSWFYAASPLFSIKIFLYFLLTSQLIVSLVFFIRNTSRQKKKNRTKRHLWSFCLDYLLYERQES